MKNLKSKIIDVICFVGGVVTLVIYLPHLQISVIHTPSTTIDYVSTPGITNIHLTTNIQYFHANDFVIIPVAIAVGLIVLGFLIRSWRKQKINSN